MNFNNLAISRDISSKIFREIRNAQNCKFEFEFEFATSLAPHCTSDMSWKMASIDYFFSFTTAVCHWKWSSQKLWWLGYYTQIRNRRAGNNFSPRFTTGPGLINHDEQKKVNSNSLQLQISFIPGTMLMKKERIFSGCCDGVAPHNGVHECLKSNM